MLIALSSGCGNLTKPGTENASDETTFDAAYTPGIGGVSNSDYRRKYIREFTNITSALVNLIDYNVFNSWVEEFEEHRRNGNDCNHLQLINDLTDNPNIKISRQEAYNLTDEQIDIMYSGDMDLIRKTFV